MNTRTYYIDSHNRINSGDSHSNFTYKIDLPNIKQADAKGLAVVCLSATIPRSYYLVRSGLNTFKIDEGGGKTATVTVPAGNYSATSFKSAVGTLMTNASPNAYTYTITLSLVTGKFSYTCTGVTSIIMFAAATSTLYEQFGFTANSTNVVPATSTNVVLFQSKNTLQIHSDMIDDGQTDILQEINTSGTTDFSSISYRCPEALMYAKQLRTNSSNVFQFRVTDEDGLDLELNGLNVVLAIKLFQPIEYLIRTYLNWKITDSEYMMIQNEEKKNNN